MDALIPLDMPVAALGLATLTLLVWAGAWALVGKRFSAKPRFAAHFGVAALAFIGILVAMSPPYLVFALALPWSDYLWLATLGAIMAWGLWRHVKLASGAPGRCATVAIVAITAALVQGYAIVIYLGGRDDLTYMAYATKGPPPHRAKGTGLDGFLQGAQKLETALEKLRAN